MKETFHFKRPASQRGLLQIWLPYLFATLIMWSYIPTCVWFPSFHITIVKKITCISLVLYPINNILGGIVIIYLFYILLCTGNIYSQYSPWSVLVILIILIRNTILTCFRICEDFNKAGNKVFAPVRGILYKY